MAKKKEALVTDYQKFTTKDMPKEEREKIGVGDIWSNAIRCTGCGDTIRSRNRHDMVFCTCGKVAIDGGSWYSQITGDCWEWVGERFDDVEKS